LGTGGRLAGYGRTCEPSRHASRAGRTQGRLRRSSFVARALRAGTEALASQPTAGLAPPWREWPRKRPGYAVHNFELQPRCGCRPGMLHSWAPPAALSACSPWRRWWRLFSPCSGSALGCGHRHSHGRRRLGVALPHGAVSNRRWGVDPLAHGEGEVGESGRPHRLTCRQLSGRYRWPR